MENENRKIGFFSRVKIAVAKLENYSMFLEEKISVAVKYFFLIVLILSLVMGAVETYSVMKMVHKGYQYLCNEMPDFWYEDGRITWQEEVTAYDEEFDFYMITDSSDNLSDEKMKEYRNTIKSIGIVLLKDKVIYKTGTDEVAYKYSDFLSEYGVDTMNKEALIQEVDSLGMLGIAATIFLLIVVSLYMIQVISIFMDWVVISIFAYLASRICRINMLFKSAFNISIYALTLSIILSMLYNIAYYIGGFYTEYFRLVYLLISYIYVVAAILMMKSDLLRQHVEVTQIVEEQKKIHEELENPETKEEEKKQHKKPEKKEGEKEEKSNEDTVGNGEPDGSEI